MIEWQPARNEGKRCASCSEGKFGTNEKDRRRKKTKTGGPMGATQLISPRLAASILPLELLLRYISNLLKQFIFGDRFPFRPKTKTNKILLHWWLVITTGWSKTV
jgi:hypothetical protein